MEKQPIDFLNEIASISNVGVVGISKNKSEKKKSNSNTTKSTAIKKDNDYEELESLFGEGFSKKDLKTMYKRYKELENNYPVGRSAMHQEALVTYVKYAYKRDQAISEDDIEAADKWGKLASKQATDAKINPSQLSAADLSDGITNFSKIAEAVEREQDIIPLLPTYNQPEDRIDYAIWQMILYIRRLQNMPEITYAELYKFLDEQYQRNAKDLPSKITKFINGYYDEA